MRVQLSTAILAGVILCGGFSAAWAKTAKECNAEYSANKAAIKSAQKKADFIAACKAGTEVIPGAASAPTPAVPPATAAKQPPTPAAPAPTAPAAPPAARATRPAPAATTAPTAANEFTTEAQAKGHCPSATVVWINTKSNVYHFAGTRDYGNTKAGAYACETDAAAAGDRASKNEKHP